MSDLSGTPHQVEQDQTDGLEYARRFITAVPYDWTQAQRIPAPFNVLETLAQAGDIEMDTVQLFGPCQQPRGKIHRFRRIRTNVLAGQQKRDAA